MTRNDLASPPAEASPPTITPDLVERMERLTAALEALAKTTGADPELRCYTPAEAAELLGVTENWVTEAIRGRRIPFTYIGRFPRLTAAHIREIAASAEVIPHKYAKPVSAPKAA